jgi:hypothetical protein
LTLGLFLGDAVSLLDTTGELLTIAFGPFEIVVGEIALLLPRLALELCPFTLDLVPIHMGAPLAKP